MTDCKKCETEMTPGYGHRYPGSIYSSPHDQEEILVCKKCGNRDYPEDAEVKDVCRKD